MIPTDSNTSALDPIATPPPSNIRGDLLSEPTFEECVVEWNRYYEDRKAGRISLDGIPEGHHLAYFGGRIIDHDPDYLALQARAAAAVGVHWARLVIDYPFMW